MATILTRAQLRFFHALLGLALFMLANSAYLFASDPGSELTVFYQLMLLAHLVGGVVLLAAGAGFLAWHLGRVKRFFRLSANASGGALSLVAALLLASGIFIIYEANSREHRWIFTAHQILALLLPVTYAVHRFVSHFRPTRRAVLAGVAGFGLLWAALLLLDPAGRTREPVRHQAASGSGDPFVPFRPRNFPGKDAPFFPASTTTASGGFAAVERVTRGELGRKGAMGAETCRRCHPDVTAQWEASAHRHSSFSNDFYRASVEALRESSGPEASKWCAGCHDPAILLPGKMLEPIDLAAPESGAGLTCLACHYIDRLHGREGNGNYEFDDLTKSPYLGDEAGSGWRRWLADQLIKAKPTAHKHAFLKPFFRRPEFCLTCHKVSVDVQLNRYRWLRGQDEYDNWHDSGVSHNAARTFYLPPNPLVCQDCHMPPEEAPLGDVSARDGTVRSHRFLAVNTALPHVRGDTDTIRRIERFLRSGKLRIDVFAVGYRDGTLVRALDLAQPVLPAGEPLVFEVVVRNKGVGHTFPGGTNDSNEAWVDFEAADEDGRVLYRSGALRPDGHVDPEAHFYRVIMVRHDGSEANERDAHNFHVAAFARVIGPGTADVARYAVTLPAELAGRKVRLRAKLQWRKFTRAYTEFTYRRVGGEVPDLPVTTIATDEVVLDVAPGRGAARPVDDPEAWVRFNDHGIASLAQGAFDVAAESFAGVARLRPDLPDGWRNQARRWIRSGTPQRAEALLLRMDEAAPSDPQRPYFWGRYFERTERFEEAEEAYLASLQVFPNDRDAWRRLGAVRYKMHEYEKSLQAYFEVLRIDPEDLEAHKRRLDIYRQLGREAEAEEARKAFDKYRLDDQAREVARRFLLEHEEINREAQPRHLHR